nr:MAG: hypothetical protein [Aspergillus flavus virga-like virus 1]
MSNDGIQHYHSIGYRRTPEVADRQYPPSRNSDATRIPCRDAGAVCTVRFDGRCAGCGFCENAGSGLFQFHSRCVSSVFDSGSVLASQPQPTTGETGALPRNVTCGATLSISRVLCILSQMYSDVDRGDFQVRREIWPRHLRENVSGTPRFCLFGYTTPDGEVVDFCPEEDNDTFVLSVTVSSAAADAAWTACCAAYQLDSLSSHVCPYHFGYLRSVTHRSFFPDRSYFDIYQTLDLVKITTFGDMRQSMPSALLFISCLFPRSRDSTVADIEENPGPDQLVPGDTVMGAWIGGALHELDVKARLVRVGYSIADANIKLQVYTSSAARSRYYKSSSVQPVRVSGHSDHSIATAFRAAYCNEFRERYLLWLRSQEPDPIEGNRSVADDLQRLEPGHEPRPDKVYCRDCGFFVNSSRHSERCHKQTNGPGPIKRICAWNGDALHCLDVRAILTYFDFPHGQLEIIAQTYSSADAQVNYLRSIGEVSANDIRSKHSISTDFEAQYYGDFRQRYVAWLFAECHANTRGKIRHGIADEPILQYIRSIFGFSHNA